MHAGAPLPLRCYSSPSPLLPAQAQHPATTAIDVQHMRRASRPSVSTHCGPRRLRTASSRACARAAAMAAARRASSRGLRPPGSRLLLLASESEALASAADALLASGAACSSRSPTCERERAQRAQCSQQPASSWWACHIRTKHCLPRPGLALGCGSLPLNFAYIARELAAGKPAGRQRQRSAHREREDVRHASLCTGAGQAGADMGGRLAGEGGGQGGLHPAGRKRARDDGGSRSLPSTWLYAAPRITGRKAGCERVISGPAGLQTLPLPSLPAAVRGATTEHVVPR